MFTNQQWIKNEYKSLKNPIITSTNNNYQGVLNDTFDFKHQKKKFAKLVGPLQCACEYARVGVVWVGVYVLLWNKLVISYFSMCCCCGTHF